MGSRAATPDNTGNSQKKFKYLNKWWTRSSGSPHDAAIHARPFCMNTFTSLIWINSIPKTAFFQAGCIQYIQPAGAHTGLTRCFDTFNNPCSKPAVTVYISLLTLSICLLVYMCSLCIKYIIIVFIYIALYRRKVTKCFILHELILKKWKNKITIKTTIEWHRKPPKRI